MTSQIKIITIFKTIIAQWYESEIDKSKSPIDLEGK